jgi:type I restriction enzyme S subunit
VNSNWKELPAAEYCIKVADGTHDTPKPLEFGEYLITSKHITGGKVDLSSAYRISNEDFAKINIRSKVDKWDVLLTMIGTVGEVVLVDHEPNYAIKNIGLFKCGNETKARWLKYYLQSPDGKAEIQSRLGGTTQEYIALGDLRKLPVLFPPIPEQRAIAGVLSSLDDKIDLLHRQNKTLEGMAAALWRKMFVEEADPGWDEKGLDEIATFLNGLPCQKFPPDTSTEPLPVIKIKELRTGITGDSDLATSKVPPDYIVDDGDILFSWSGSLEVVIWSFGKGVLNQHLFKVTSDDYPKWFCYFWIKHHLSEFRDIAQDKATTMGHIQRHHLSDAKVLIPDQKSFQYLDMQIGPVFEKMIHNLKAIRRFARLRDTLLPKLMSGEVRVKP